MKQLCEVTNSKEILKMANFSNKKQWWSWDFYPSYKGGYNMRLSARCTKDGDLSRYVYFTAGRYDDTLTCPFASEICIELLNQLEDKNHTVRVLNFHNASPTAKQKPINSTGTTGWGYPQFIVKNELSFNSSLNRQYLKDDTLYFRVSVIRNPPSSTPWLLTYTSTFEH